MKLKDLDPKIDIGNVKIKLTEDLKKAYDEYAGPHDTDEVYIVGDMMGDFFISTDAPDKTKRQLYPMPVYRTSQEFLECEVITSEV
jgi:hypothetical protein